MSYPVSLPCCVCETSDQKDTYTFFFGRGDFFYKKVVKQGFI